MGRNKALLNYRGTPLIGHMQHLLNEAGAARVAISGIVPGYDGISDDEDHAGPARAMNGMIQRFPEYRRFLFVPVDMPLLQPRLLQCLIAESSEGSVWFSDHPLPALICGPHRPSEAVKVRALLDAYAARQLVLDPMEAASMVNLNTPQDLADLARHET